MEDNRTRSLDVSPLPHRSRPILLLLLLLSAVEAAVFFLPYHFSVPPSIALSYQVGYSNKAALIIFLFGSLMFAAFARGGIGRVDTRDSSLRPAVLLASLLLVLGMCLTRSYMLAGSEARYIWHRQELLLTGRHLYTQMDFFYGPLLVMPGVWFARHFHLSGQNAYCLSWTLQWLFGTCFIYLAVRALPVAFQYRTSLFFALMIEAVTAIEDQGTNYSPFRRYASTVLVVLVYRVFRKSGVWPGISAGVIAVMLGLAVSPEQAIATAAGLLCWWLLHAWIFRSRQFLLAALIFLLGSAACFASLIPTGYFEEFQGAASGGHSFPILATPDMAAFLFLYAIAVCIAYGCIRQSRQLAFTERSSLTCLYVFTGLAMLPAAFGRCDVGHFRLAFPALLIAVATLLAIPRARPWLAVPALFIYLQIFSYGAAALQLVPDQIHSAKVRRVTGQYISGPLGDGAVLVPPHAGNLPCDRQYYTPSITLALGVPYKLNCVDVGYRWMVQDTYTEAQIDRQLGDLRARPSIPLLLLNRPLAEEFPTPEIFLKDLPALEGGPTAYIPKVRHPAMTLSPLAEYIQVHYQPGATVLNGQVRIWNPIR